MAAATIHPFDRRVAESQMSKSDVNNLIMDYLINEGYPSAAEKFAKEANIDQQPDHSFIDKRVEIRNSIHKGDLQHAIEQINDLNPELLDKDTQLHFSLLRLQLVELIRSSFTSASSKTDPKAVEQAIHFAQHNLAPYATISQSFKTDLERAMALLIVPRESWTQPSTSSSSQTPANDFGALSELVDPSLRRKIAKDVNEAILNAQGQKREANIRHLVRTRAWAEQLARDRKLDLPEGLSLGLDGDESSPAPSNGHSGGGDTEMGDNTGADDGRSTRRPPSGSGPSSGRRSRATSGITDAMMSRYTNHP